MSELNSLKIALSELGLNGTKENLIKVLNEICRILPPSDDISISIGKKGAHEYVLDRKGLAIITTSLDEYLPYLSSSEKRISMEQLPDDLAKKAITDLGSIITQVRDVFRSQAKRNARYKALADEVDNIVKDKGYGSKNN
ncbi:MULTISPECIES: hypothetical protein [Metallosphaera]|uniref:Uncharacterized protein n=1 Tax=Metallosphaera cuprina (strain Ar-4) TaxID=1006006 RepID=F4FYS6_METCR|nr:hypothetical protein [Metallosphaera cuprina]AEB94315.1 conserved hypothetical protein [Metallosphaera cuprina Ar-4]